MIANKPTRAEAGKRGTMFPISAIGIALVAPFPEMNGFSPRKLIYARALTAACTDRQIVQAGLAQVIWYQPIKGAEWETQLTRALPQQLERRLPTIDEVEAELSGDVGDVDE